MKTFTTLTITAIAASLLLTSCTAAPNPSASKTPITQPTITQPEVEAAKPAVLTNYEISTDTTMAPTIVVNPEAGNVTEMLTATITPGTGDATVQPGETVTVQYTGVAAISGKQFDSSWTRGQTSTFGLNQVIQGWQTGIVGMKVGERRLLVIPAEQAYGNNPPTPDIQPGETLIFVVDLISIGS